MLTPGGQVPEFRVSTIDGRSVEYAALWQRKNLLLVTLSPAEPDASRRYASTLESRRDELTAHDTELVITTHSLPDLAGPAVLIADRWGEIFFAARPTSVAGLPAPAELIESLRFVQQQCPECQGETR